MPWTDGHITAFLSNDVPAIKRALLRSVELQEKILTEMTLARSALQKLVKYHEDRNSVGENSNGGDDPA